MTRRRATDLSGAQKLNRNLRAAALTIIAAHLAACTPGPEPERKDVRPVRTVVAGRTAGSVGATYSGEIRARYESQLGFRTAGKIVARMVEVGSHVKRGQPLFQLDTTQETLQVAAAGAEADAARGRVAQARVDVKRTEQLLAQNFASQAELDQQRLALNQAEAQLRSAQARQQLNANMRGFTTLVADRDGVVSAINAEAGQVVSAGQTVATVAADGEREVSISIPESRVDELRKAPTLTITVWAQPDKSWTGKLRELAPDADGVTRTYSARISIQEADPELRLGMTASVIAPDVDGSGVVRVPLTAIVDHERGRQVWVVDPKTSRVIAREVKLGAAQNDSVIVVGGLAGGETVVSAGVHMLQAGQQVKVAEAVTVARAGGAK
ncbi:efflux transporter, RND family, MFP subunit (plasmid) [Cupriavidus necator N-1]|uniref:Efflux transporter, RND family, MFP subunit n=1 Tax=Cupriavidus necator (strain ATCC 43291 / DSM 13513 / CCUG 52238 / LMG 8453 / N-1) TaxID=1042878 RepID=F8GWI9_CUPNN|nr:MULTISPECIES: efflux RND transporter periplasmic adaptor subunit [Cupriavidus]AEI82797.1 efflux transporter, RND family, MFP subunit [Cupriavidus necator N-1]MDX6007792.1 efflux RND transporter periplasmic adaptor subunit [Cupriavidus necator]